MLQRIKKLLPMAVLLGLLAGLGLLTAINLRRNVALQSAHTVDGWTESLNTAWDEAVFRKDALSRLNTYYSYYISGNLDNTQVVLGKDHWLFYSTQMDGDPIADYEGRTQLDEESISASVLELQNWLEGYGMKFALIIPPNKEQVYPEYMPGRYHQQEVSAADSLMERMEQDGVHVVNPKQTLLDAKSDYQLYYKYDTHWNQLGAYLGTAQVLQELGIEVEPLGGQTISAQLLTPIRHYCAGEDLATIVSMDWPYHDDMEYTVDGTNQPDWNGLSVVQEIQQVYTHFENPAAPHQETVLLVGDSFRASMLPLLNQQFRDVYVVMLKYYDLNMLKGIMPQYVIWECVERRTYVLEGGAKQLRGEQNG